jgi:hypothetical protein
VHFRGVLDDDHELALGPGEAEFGDRRGAVGEKPFLVGRVGPRPGHHLRPVHRAEVVFEVRDDRIDGVGVEDALVDEYRFDRGDARLDRRQFRGVVMVGRHRGSSR